MAGVDTEPKLTPERVMANFPAVGPLGGEIELIIGTIQDFNFYLFTRLSFDI
jgi:hypothetical protein